MTDEPRRVVLVDDDEDLLFATGLALRGGGFEAVPFSDCDAAAAALAAAPWHPWAILLDVHLAEGMAPAAFIAWLREHGLGDVPVLVVSGSVDAAAIARSIGAAGCLPKPFSLPDLLDRVGSARG